MRSTLRHVWGGSCIRRPTSAAMKRQKSAPTTAGRNHVTWDARPLWSRWCKNVCQASLQLGWLHQPRHCRRPPSSVHVRQNSWLVKRYKCSRAVKMLHSLSIVLHTVYYQLSLCTGSRMRQGDRHSARSHCGGIRSIFHPDLTSESREPSERRQLGDKASSA